MEDTPQTPTHADDPQLPEKRPDHRFAVYHPKSNVTMMPFIVTKHDHGEIVTAIARPKLQKSQGHIAALPLGEYDPHFKQKMPVWIATADGFRYANTVAGWSITFPQQVHVPGVGLAPNPYIEVDSSGAFVKGFARAIGIGRSALTGDLMIVDRPTHISVQSYIEEDLASKAQYHPTAIVWGTRAMNPMDAVRDAVRRRNEEVREKISFEKQDWKKKKLEKDIVHEVGIEIAESQHQSKMWEFRAVSRVDMHKSSPHDIGLWINMGATVVTRVFTTLVGKRKFGARLLPAVAERNVLRTALGFYRAPEGAVNEAWPSPDRDDGTYGKAPRIRDAVWAPPVTVHRMNFTPAELDDLRNRYLAGMEGGILRQAQIDCSLEENSGDNLMIVEPAGDPDMGERGSGSSVVIEVPEDSADKVEEMDERQRLILDAKQFQEMVEMDTADELRRVCFDDPVFVDMKAEPLENIRKYVGLLRKNAQDISKKEVTSEEKLFDKEGEGDG